jgi:putative transposase
VLTNDDLLAWFSRWDISKQAQTLISQIRSTPPSRRVGGGRANVTGRYPSKKMGVTIQFESHQVELAGIREMEHDSSVLEYFDQPLPIPLKYKSAAGRQMCVLHTPDFFVIKADGVGWEEWKTEEALQQLTERNRFRYSRDVSGKWECPPGSEFANQLGLYYRVRSTSEINWIFQRNMQFMEDYLRDGSCYADHVHRELALKYASGRDGVSLAELLKLTTQTVSADAIFGMIASGVLHVDLHSDALAEPDSVRVFASAETWHHNARSSVEVPDIQRKATLSCGGKLTWDGRILTLVNVGTTQISLMSEQQELIELPIHLFETLVHENRIAFAVHKQEESVSALIQERISQASESALHTATLRTAHIREYLEAGTLPERTQVSERTFYRWLTCYRQAEVAYGNGFIGLLPDAHSRGNRNGKLPQSSLVAMQDHIGSHYETLKQRTRYASWSQLKLACEARGIPTPSYRTFCTAVRKRPAHEQTLKRKGRRASYRLEPFHWDLSLKTPRHGDRPFEIAHVDHTELDVECIARSGQPLGRPWLTLLTDAYSRRVLAFYLTFDPPSYRSCMMVMRECIQRFNRFPQTLVLDGGKEFASAYFETLLARYECTKKTRPPAKARFGSICERLFGITNTRFIHNLKGNTQNSRNVREITKSIAPKSFATWSLTELHGKMAEYFYEVHDRLRHPALGCSPREAYETALTRSGSRLRRMVAYDEEFLMLTLPTTARGKAKVSPSRGVKINNVYYWSESFRHSADRSVAVRYDPFDAGIAYAYVGRQWVKCHSECYVTLKGRSERELMIATAEMRRQHHNHSRHFSITARRVAEFLQSIETEEVLLTQRLRDHENHSTRLELVADAIRSSEDESYMTRTPQAAPSSSTNTMPAAELYGEF